MLLLLGLALTGYAEGDDLVQLFAPEDHTLMPFEEGPATDLAGAALRARPVTLAPEAFTVDALAPGTLIEMPAFADAVLRAHVDRATTDVNGTQRIRARIESDPSGMVLWTVDGDRVFGVIEQPSEGRKFLIRRTEAAAFYTIEEVDPTAMDVLHCAECARVHSRPVPGPAMQPLHEEGSIEIRSENGAEVDVMILYTPAARDWANSWAGGINSSIAQSMERAQLVADNSGVDLTFKLVHSALVNYQESGNAGIDLDRLTDTNSGYMDEIHAWRDAYGADLVALFTLEHFVGGIAHLLDWKPGAPDRGFSVTRIQQAHNTYTHIHEMGHNLGLHHRKDQAQQPGPTEWWANSWPGNTWSAGWRWIGNNGTRYCSVMSYSENWDGNSVFTVAHFSNPDVFHQGQPTGHAQDGDNVRTLRETKHVVASYRDAVSRVLTISGDLHFGEVVIGESAQRTLTLHNEGTEDLAVSGMDWPTGFSGTWTGVIPVGQSQAVTVTFSPMAPDFYAGAVRVLSDATGGHPWHTLSGYGDAPGDQMIAITDPVSGTTVAHDTDTLTISGTAGTDIIGDLLWSNSLTGASGLTPALINWELSTVELNVGSNWIHLRGTNQPLPTLRADDSASHPVYSSGWSDGQNGGFGFEPWDITVYGNNGGHFRGSSDIGNQSWGLWANSGQQNIDDSTVVAVRPLTQSLAPSNTFLVKFQNKWIMDNKSVGIGLQNADGEYLIEFMFIGGDQTYTINDRQVGRDSGISYTGQGLHLAIDLIDADTYRLRTGAHTVTGELAHRADMRISEFRAWNFSAGPGPNYDFFINDLAVTNPSLAAVTATAETLVMRPAIPDQPKMAIHADGADGLVLSWPPPESGHMALYRSTNLLLPNSGFLPFTNIPFGQNTYTVIVNEVEGDAFFRIELEAVPAP